MIAPLALAGCAPALPLAPKPVLVSQDWSAGAATRNALPTAPLAVLLGSPELGALTERALLRNTDVRMAKARVDQATAVLRAAQQNTLPSVSASAGTSRERRFNDGLPDISKSFASLSVVFDLDVFGKLRAQRQAVVARGRAAELESAAVRLAIESDLAAAYVQHAALAARIAIVDGNMARATELERIVRVRVEAGASTRVDLGLQSLRLLNLREQRSRLAQSFDQTRTALSLLTGEEAPTFLLVPAKLAGFARPNLALPAPATLLAVRPDVGAAEALIAAANGDVLAARANFFPQLDFSLGGIADMLGGALGKTVTLGSSLLVAVFDRGRLTSEFAYASAVQVEVVERYRQTILTALKEAEDARAAIECSGERAELMTQIAAQATDTSRLAQLQYVEGEEDLLSVLDAQQLLNESEDGRVLATQEQLFAQIALYRAVGGMNNNAVYN